MSEYEQEAYAYDAVRGEDVQITCHHADMPHDFDVVDAVATDDHRGGDEETAQEHDRLISTDLDHDPVEGCQGSYTRIVELTCPFCGYDRCDKSVHTMAGVAQLTCRRCGASQHDGGEWSRPESDAQRLQKEKEWSEVAGWLGTATMYSEGDKPLFRSDNGGYLQYWWEHYGEPRHIDPDDALDRLLLMVDDGAFDADQLGDMLTTAVEADAFDPESIQPLDRCVAAATLLPDKFDICPAEDDDE
ncbi:hypothetical protein PN419_00525 [Halorubrum ezzemoulense]|uniref:hypothetical protein n=1 Tax=Halorubrum ezzemoulense TaxID=337243 RepID=UPI00232DB688|nr:hypothetical protein [Halorubrum ezzemoulense]MDB9247492.1 hypothetical protein [Halorubrum ezzemoulense]MDB9258599.1 hypothetical protein [Halorubrum ezzemoulense]MDB9264542.1 hypothetical protein [Halorubrum ezzemoulense]MDB9268960.1 hypothetical protein [Halorubrum ezzemoulense]MDB9271510.1 hypothetical protein [Halorubrum ezzemoulense]